MMSKATNSASISVGTVLPSLLRSREQTATANAILLVLMLIGDHTTLSLSFTPHRFLEFSAGVGIFIVNYRSIPPRLWMWFPFSVVVFSAFFSLISLRNGVPIGLSVRSALNFVYDISVGVALFIAFMQLGSAKIQKLYFKILIVLICGAMLEVVGILKPLSDWFRNAVNSTSVYALDGRDLTLYGLIRPKLFSPEPSDLGISISVAFFFWFGSIQKPKPADYGVASVLLLAAFFFVRSPVIFFGAVAYGLTLCVTRVSKGNFVDRVFRYIPIAYAGVAVFVPFAFLLITTFMPNPPAYIMSGSFFARVIAPFFMALQTLAAHPLGIGFADDDALTQIAITAFVITGHANEVPLNPAVWQMFGAGACNAFWFTLISFGFVGPFVLWWQFRRVFKILYVPFSFWIIANIGCLTFWYAFGRVNSTIAWLTFFGVAAVCALRVHDRQALENSVDRTKSLN